MGARGVRGTPKRRVACVAMREVRKGCSARRREEMMTDEVDRRSWRGLARAARRVCWATVACVLAVIAFLAALLWAVLFG